MTVVAHANFSQTAQHPHTQPTAQPLSRPPMKSFFALAALAVACSLATAGATKLLLINNSQDVPGTTSMFTYDTETKALSKKPIFSKTGITGGSDSFISGTVTCGNTFFGIWANAPMAAGVAMIDLATGNNTYTTTTGSTLTIYHSLACDPKSTAASPSVIGVATQPSGGKMVNIKLFRLDMTTGASTAIGSFPAGVNFDGYDNMFAFTSDGTQLYAAFPNNSFNQKVTTGSLYVMDTATGKIVEGPKTFKGSTAGGVKWGKGVGMPYDLYPTGKDTFRAGFVHTQTNVIHLCDVDKSGKDVEVSNCAKTPGLASESTRSPACADGEIYATHQYGNAGASQPLFKIDVATGASTQLVDLSTVIQDVYTVNVACAPTSELTVSASWLASKGAAAATHYEDPSAGGCQSGEEAVQIQGVKGNFCSPACGLFKPCPKDVPTGTTATPECALETPGSKSPSRCALICQSSSKCPTNASCKTVQAGIGVCTYDS